MLDKCNLIDGIGAFLGRETIGGEVRLYSSAPPSPTQKERGYTLDEARMYPLYSVGILATETDRRPVARKGDTTLGQG